MPENVLKIEPIGENYSLNARIYDELKSAIVTMNIYDENAELRLDERTLSDQFGISRGEGRPKQLEARVSGDVIVDEQALLDRFEDPKGRNDQEEVREHRGDERQLLASDP